MINLMLNVAPQTLAQGSPAEASPLGEVGHTFFLASLRAAGDVNATNALRFGAMLHDAELPAAVATMDAEALAQIAHPTPEDASDGNDDASGAHTMAVHALGVPIHVTAPDGSDTALIDTALIEAPPAELPTHETTSALAPTVPMIAATPVPAEAILGRESMAPPAVQGTMSLSLGSAALPIPQTSVPFAALPTLAASSLPADPGSTRPESALLQLASQSVTGAAATLAVFAGEPAPTNVADRHGNVARQPLEMLLGERLQVQIARRSEHAVVRLDPPSMGTIEIVIRQEGANLHVQLRASNSEVARQLQVIGETLRQDLVQRQHGEVSVHVWDASREGERQRQRAPFAWQDEPGRALHEDGEERASFAMNTASE